LRCVDGIGDCRRISLQLGAGPYLEKPDGGPEWKLRAAVTASVPEVTAERADRDVVEQARQRDHRDPRARSPRASTGSRSVRAR